MRCPKCDTFSEERFCPGCGLDLQIYSDLAAIKSELEQLRALLITQRRNAAAQVQPITGRPEAVSDSEALPPPLPPPLQVPRPPEVSRNVRKPGESPEIAIGQKWLLAGGVLVLIIGIGFFLKYAFDQNWFGPAARISVGFALGIFLLVAADLCRRRNLSGLDVGLGSVGLGALYLTSYAAAQVYELLPDSLALCVMLLTTAAGVMIALIWNSQVLAGLTFMGGYLAPLLFGVTLFGHWLFLGYLIVLTLGGQTLALAKLWRSLSWLGAALVWVLMTDYTSRAYRPEWRQETLLFTHLIFFAYSILPFVHAAVKRIAVRSPLFFLAICNGLLSVYFSNDLLRSAKWPTAFVCLGYAAVSLVFSLLLSRRQASEILSAWLAGQTLTFLLLFFAKIFAVQWVLVAWSAELVALYWIAAKCDDSALLTGTFLLGCLNVCGFFYGSFRVTLESQEVDVFSAGLVKRWCSGLSVVLALLLVTWLDRGGRVRGSRLFLSGFFEFLGIATLFGFLNLELSRYSEQYLHQGALAAYSGLWCLFAAGMMVYGLWERRKSYRTSAIGLLFVTLLKVLVFDTAQVSTPYRILSCIILGMVMVAVSFAYYRFKTRLMGK